MRRALAVPAVALASALALAGCSTIAQVSGSRATKPKGIISDFGVTRAEIALGALTDRSGPFSEIDSGVLHGQQMWVKDTNTGGGVCGRKIKLESRDDGDNLATTKAHYAALEPKVLGFTQVTGSSVTAALSQSLIDNETTVVTLSKSSELLSNP